MGRRAEKTSLPLPGFDAANENYGARAASAVPERREAAVESARDLVDGASRALGDSVVAYLTSMPGVRAEVVPVAGEGAGAGAGDDVWGRGVRPSGFGVEAVLTFRGVEYREVVALPSLAKTPTYDLAPGFGLRIYMSLCGRTPAFGGRRATGPIALKWTRPELPARRGPLQLELVGASAARSKRR